MKLYKITPILVLIVFIGLIIYLKIPKKKVDYRPLDTYCDENGCVPKEVFQYLPPYPSNFHEVWLLVYFGRISYLENFSSKYPDENYWKQPEFYGNTFTREGLKYYTKLKPGKPVLYNIAGTGPYPGDVVIKDVKSGEEVKAYTFWHASWGVVKYQGFSLEPRFPKEGKVRMGTISVKQDPEKARQCFSINIKPNPIILEPTYPVFFYGWTKKIEIDIKVNENCTPGWYMISVEPTDAPKEYQDEWIREYGLKMATMIAGGVWQVFVQVK